MTTTIRPTGHEHVDRLERSAFADAAADAARSLSEHGHALVDLMPGDATHYTIGVFAHPARREPYTVCLVSPRGWSYPWMGTPLSADYVEAKWADHPWTAAVLTRFLAELAAALAEGD